MNVPTNPLTRFAVAMALLLLVTVTVAAAVLALKWLGWVALVIAGLAAFVWAANVVADELLEWQRNREACRRFHPGEACHPGANHPCVDRG